jgi:hypothetical protein
MTSTTNQSDHEENKAECGRDASFANPWRENLKWKSHQNTYEKRLGSDDVCVRETRKLMRMKSYANGEK